MGDAKGLLEDQVAIVTGGASGIGGAIVARFAEEGARGAVFDQVNAPDVDLPRDWIFVHADVRNPDSLQSAFNEVLMTFQRLDVVVANAGVVPPWTTTIDIDLLEWERVFSINSLGVMLTIREAVRAMQERGGSIVATSSLNGWRGDPHIPAYVASKHAVVGLVRSVALDVGSKGIRVNAVGPGPIATEALLSRMSSRASTPGRDVAQLLHEAGASTALGRIATAQEVANAVLFLSSDLASGITGHLLPIDAGIL
jgi:NAD(P)-dependent dehydrogenase (short-subunit alcohol dehydrogenase family)